MVLDLKDLRRELKKLSDPAKAVFFPRFFKTGPGEYGAGDKFRGVTVPAQRKLARAYQDLPIRDAEKLLDSSFHEDRLTALFLLIRHYRKGDEAQKENIHRLYLRKWKRVNNWDLVDSSAEHLVGANLDGKNSSLLTKWAKSSELWQRRIAMIACYHDIKKKDFRTPLKIAALLLRDEEDLIHKAVGWMLREIGKRDETVERKFLDRYAAKMPRTMLRYAIERFPERGRKRYLAMGR